MVFGSRVARTEGALDIVGQKIKKQPLSPSSETRPCDHCRRCFRALSKAPPLCFCRKIRVKSTTSGRRSQNHRVKYRTSPVPVPNVSPSRADDHATRPFPLTFSSVTSTNPFRTFSCDDARGRHGVVRPSHVSLDADILLDVSTYFSEKKKISITSTRDALHFLLDRDKTPSKSLGGWLVSCFFSVTRLRPTPTRPWKPE